MSDPDANPGQAPDVSGQGPQVSGQGPQPEPDVEGQAPAADEPVEIKRLRAEAADYRKKLRALEQEVKRRDDEKLSETERLQARLAELEQERTTYQTERQERILRYETMLAASKLGIIDPEAAYKLLDVSQIEFDDDGAPKNLERCLHALLEAKPYLAAAGHASPTNPARERGAGEDAFTAALMKGAGLGRKS